MGWNKGIQNITTYLNQDGTTIDLISQYGQIDHQTLKNACEEFVKETGARGQQRAAQNNEQMWRCINDSLTEQAKAKVLSYREDYEIDDNGTKKIAAPLLYKTVMRLATLDSNATDRQLRTNLRELTSYAIRENGNIDKIHTYFDQNYTQLRARGQAVDDVHSILFDAYLAVPDAEFHQYMKRLHDDWMDQVGEMKGIKFEHLMQRAKAKYDLLVSLGKWGTKWQEQEELIALKAQLEGMKDAALQLTKKLKNASNQTKGKMKKDTESKRGQKKDEAWKKVPPKEGEPTSKTVGKKTWHWCEHHMAFTVHKPQDCKLGKQRAEGKTNIFAKAAVQENDSSKDDGSDYITALLANLQKQQDDHDE